jgi:hypothetical protein
MKSALIALFLCFAMARAQTPFGTVTGLATDATGSAIPAASVTLTNQQTGVKRTYASNDSGAYTPALIGPGGSPLRCLLGRPAQTAILT